jgi:hypothetical protein
MIQLPEAIPDVDMLLSLAPEERKHPVRTALRS